MLNSAPLPGLSALPLRTIPSLPILLGLGKGIRVPGQVSVCRGNYEEALSLILQTRTVEAREKLRGCVATGPANADPHYQLARTHIVDFNQSRTAAAGRESLGQAVRELDRALAIDPEHLNALRLKYPIHRGKGSSYYDPGGAHEVARKVMALQPSSRHFLLHVAEWMGLSGGRFYADTSRSIQPMAVQSGPGPVGKSSGRFPSRNALSASFGTARPVESIAPGVPRRGRQSRRQPAGRPRDLRLGRL